MDIVPAKSGNYFEELDSCSSISAEKPTGRNDKLVEFDMFLAINFFR